MTTAEEIDALALAQTYIHRWSAQENVIKDFLLPLGLDMNHGFAKTPVVNSEVSKKRFDSPFAALRELLVALGMSSVASPNE